MKTAHAHLRQRQSSSYSSGHHDHPYRLQIYPAFCFPKAPTYKKWVKLTIADLRLLREERGFRGQNVFFLLNHPIEYVYLIGTVVGIHHIVPTYNAQSPIFLLELDDGSGETVEIRLNTPVNFISTNLGSATSAGDPRLSLKAAKEAHDSLNNGQWGHERSGNVDFDAGAGRLDSCITSPSSATAGTDSSSDSSLSSSRERKRKGTRDGHKRAFYFQRNPTATDNETPPHRRLPTNKLSDPTPSLLPRIHQTIVQGLVIQTFPPTIASPSLLKISLDGTPIEIGTTLKAKGTLYRFRSNLQMSLRRASIVTSTDEEVAAWEDYAVFTHNVLCKPWVMDEADRKDIATELEQERWKKERARIKERTRAIAKQRWEERAREKLKERDERLNALAVELDGNALDKPGWKPYSAECQTGASKKSAVSSTPTDGQAANAGTDAIGSEADELHDMLRPREQGTDNQHGQARVPSELLHPHHHHKKTNSPPSRQITAGPSLLPPQKPFTSIVNTYSNSSSANNSNVPVDAKTTSVPKTNRNAAFASKKSVRDIDTAKKPVPITNPVSRADPNNNRSHAALVDPNKFVRPKSYTPVVGVWYHDLERELS